MNQYTTYLFDFDYTLADSSVGIVKCYRIVLQRHGYLSNTDEEIKRTIGKTLEESFTILTGETDPHTLAEWRKEYTIEADQYMNSNTVLFPDTLAVLQKLKEQGAQLGIISTKYRRRIRNFFEGIVDEHFWDILIGGEDVTHAKPHPEGILKALSQLGITRDKVLYVGDSIVDAQTAEAAGVDFAGVLTGTTTSDEFTAYPHRAILNNLKQLPDLNRSI